MGASRGINNKGIKVKMEKERRPQPYRVTSGVA